MNVSGLGNIQAVSLVHQLLQHGVDACKCNVGEADQHVGAQNTQTARVTAVVQAHFVAFVTAIGFGHGVSVCVLALVVSSSRGGSSSSSGRSSSTGSRHNSGSGRGARRHRRCR